MKKWVWHIGFAAAVGALIAACSSSNGIDPSAGTSLETENSVAVVLAVKQSDGSPAARTKVLVRPVDFLAGANNMDVVKDIAMILLAIMMSTHFFQKKETGD